jgi:hypothetical protein
MVENMKFKCPFCPRCAYSEKDSLVSHISSKHDDKLGSLSASQLEFNFRNRYELYKEHGSSVLSGKPTPWNNQIGRYERFANDKEIEEYKKQFRERMMSKHGTVHLLDNPEQQKKMLANRKISGEHKFANGKVVVYTGSYEKHFIEFMDEDLGWDSKDIFMPAPKVIEYHNPETNKTSFYIPDVWIASYDLYIEIKASDNKHYRARDIEIEIAKEKAMKKEGKTYIKVMDKNYDELMKWLFNN